MRTQMDQCTVIGYDPGGTTGWCVISIHPDALVDPEVLILDNVFNWSSGQFIGTEFEQVDKMCGLADIWEDAILVAESFVLRKFSSDSELLSPVRVTAAFAYEMRRHGRDRRVHKQPPSLAMTFITDERLKALRGGFFNGTAGSPHARDAVRHTLTFFNRLKTQPKLLKEVYPSLAVTSRQVG